MIFDQAWEIAKMGYPGMPLDETSVYYDTIRERLGLGEPFDTGEQRRVFNILGQPNFVAKVVNRTGSDSPYKFGGEGNPPTGTTDSGMFEDYAYPSIARVIPRTAEKFLVPGETMGLDQNIAMVVRQPRVKVHPAMVHDDFMNTKGGSFENDFFASAKKELEDRGFPIELPNKMNPAGSKGWQYWDELTDFIHEQDLGSGNFSDDMRLLDYYWPYSEPGEVFRR